MIGAALVAALLATFLAARWLGQRAAPATIDRIAVAAVDVAAGQKLGAEHIRMIEWAAKERPVGTFAAGAPLEGRVAKGAIARNEAILEGKLLPTGATGGLSAVIGAGRRAITVRVNDVVGVAGFALPGNYVDVIVNTRTESGGVGVRDDDSISKIVLERILVLAVAQEASRDDTKPRVVNAVTLEVTPVEAEKIDLARSVGTLSLVLRNQLDADRATSTGVTKDALIGGGARPKPVAAKPSTAPAPTPASTPPAVPPAMQITPTSTTPLADPRPTVVDSRTCVSAVVGGKAQRECF